MPCERSRSRGEHLQEQRQVLNGFFAPRPELKNKIQFGFVFSEYRCRGGNGVRRLPTGRATICYANAARSAAVDAPVTGLFCEGPRPKAWRLSLESGELIAFKVHAGALKTFLGIPARELRDRTVALDSVWGSRATALAERMASAESRMERIALLEQALVERCRASAEPNPITAAVAQMEQRSGRIQVAELADRTGHSQRSLLNRFDDWLGLTPKQYARLARVRASIVRLVATRDDTDSRLAALALECGFYDQAHMIHEFQDLLGHPPRGFIRQHRSFSPIGAPCSGRRALPLCEQQLYESLGQVSRWVHDSE
jgi:AraC-like DNA-binding protein